MSADPIPLCVDLDGTLIREDLSILAAWLFVRGNPLRIFLLGLWIVRGRGFLKTRLTEHVAVDWESLSYREDVIAWLRSEKNSGRTLVLVSGSPQAYVRLMAERLGLFSEFRGSDESVNLIGCNKRRWLLERFGERGYDYIGDSRSDIPIFGKARRAYLVGKSPALIRAARSRADVARVFND